MSARLPDTAMVLAAGLGKRMRPITETTPKPLVRVGGKPLIDWGLDALAAAGVETAVVNVHHLAEQVEAHLAERVGPKIVVSDERDMLLESAGGIVRALPLLGADPFFVLNADTFWIDRGQPNLERLALAWNGAAMDILLMLAAPEQATGHSGRMDFAMDAQSRLRRAEGGDGFIYAGAAIIHPRVFAGEAARPYSLNVHFDRAIAAGRLYGVRLEGEWITVGTPESIVPAEDTLSRLGIAT